MEKTPTGNAIGILEFSQVARGIWAADTMVKTAAVELKMAQTICPGKFLVLIGGAVGAVESALTAGKALAAEWVVDDLFLANVHPAVFPALYATTQTVPDGAMGIVETFSAAAAVQAADAAVKAAGVDLLEIRLARGLGGRSFVIVAGGISAVQVAISHAASHAKEKGFLVDALAIPAPHVDVWQSIV